MEKIISQNKDPKEKWKPSISYQLIYPWVMTFSVNHNFPSYLVPLFQNESLCKTCHLKMSLIDVGGQKQQEKGNSEMAYWLILVQESTSQSNHLSPGPTSPCPKAPRLRGTSGSADWLSRVCTVVSHRTPTKGKCFSRRCTFWAHHALHSKVQLVIHTW